MAERTKEEVWEERVKNAESKTAELQRRLDEMEDRNSAEEAARDRAGDAGYTAGNLDGAGYASGYHRGGGAGGADTFGAGGAATSFRDGPVQQQQYRDRRPPVYGNFDREQQEREQEAKRSLANMKMQLGEEPEKYFLRLSLIHI